MEQNYKHKAIVLGVVVERAYYVEEIGNRYNPRHIIAFRLIKESEEPIWTGDLDIPILKEGDILYIEHLNKDVKITKVRRSTNNEVYYHTNEVSREIESEYSEQTQDRAVKKLKSIEERKHNKENDFFDKINNFFHTNKNKK